MTYFSDRGYIFINGVELGFVKDISWSIDESVAVVSTMARNKRDAGYKQGNKKVSGSFSLEVPDNKAQIDLAFLYGQDVSMICTLGNGERHSLLGVAQNSQDLNASVGETGKSIKFTALDAVNENGPAVNAGIGF